MSGVNKLVLVGRLGADPELRTSAKGNEWCKVALATNRNHRGQDGNWEEVADWHHITLFGKTAQAVCKYTRKGNLIGVEGSLHYDAWVNPEGEKSYRTKITGHRVHFLGSTRRAEATPSESPEVPAPALASYDAQADAEIPF